jgi:hypothetical protein
MAKVVITAAYRLGKGRFSQGMMRPRSGVNIAKR